MEAIRKGKNHNPVATRADGDRPEITRDGNSAMRQHLLNYFLTAITKDNVIFLTMN